MKSFSIRRVAHYARYHYTSMRNNYLGMLLTMLAFPVVFGILDRDVTAAAEISMTIYLFAGIAFALRTTWAMRNKGTLVLDSALPVSKGERFTFMLFNLAVAYPLACYAVAVLSMLIVAPFSREGTLAEAMNDYFVRFAFEWAVYVIVQIVTSACLLINLAARRSLIVAYMGAMVGVIAFTIGTSAAGGWWMNAMYEGNVDLLVADVDASLKTIQWIVTTIFILTPIVFYALAYSVLRRRQVKW